MASMPSSSLRCLSLLLLLAHTSSVSATVPTPSSPSSGHHEHKPPQHYNTYIVHTDHLTKPSHFATLGHWYTSMVASLSPSTNSSRVFYVYDTAMHGFAAELTDAEARRLSSTPGVAGVHKDRVVHLHTTRSPGFLGLDKDFGIWPDTDFGDGVIIGFVDSGIWPESASFDDAGLSPVRPSWKGRCDDGERFNASMCNNKLVGARFFTAGTSLARDDFLSPRDKAGHGTHVASTAAGAEVHGASLLGFARGAARGVAPKARVAMYKACVLHACSSAGIVAAIDAAVKDGVDVLSLSVGGLHDPDFYRDPMSIALFGAVRAGVFVACSAGNFGPREATLSNVAPWITTVGAATVDRLFPASVTLGDGQVLTGQSLYAHATANRTEMIPLLPSNCSNDLVSDRITGKIVMCARDLGVYPSYGVAVHKAGGSGLISVSPVDRRVDGLMVQAFTLPVVTISAREADTLAAYISSVPDPMASFRFTGRTVTGENRAPMVPSFSSRGPNHIVRDILKPDVIAPGANILAAWPDESPLTQSKGDARRSSFNVVSGTSMACPHVAGVAALLKHKHRDWTPAMIRSALMTTAATLDSHGRPIADNSRTSSGGVATPMAAGAGHVRPQLALDPGLVYDAVEQDYVDFLCSLSYTAAQIRTFVPGFGGCTRTLPGGAAGLKYPSFVVDFSNGTAVRVLKRTVTKVSEGPETYTARVVAPDQVTVTVTPRTLQFDKKNEKKSYKVVFRSKDGAAGLPRFGHIVWENDVHQVRSPVEFRWMCSGNQAFTC